MKKRRVSRKRRNQLVIPSWMFVVATIIVIGLIGWYMTKNDTSGADAATLSCSTIQSAKIVPSDTQTLWVGDTANFSVCATNATYLWTINTKGSTATASITNTSSSTVTLTAKSAPSKGGKISLQVKITPKGQISGSSKVLTTSINVSPSRQIASVKINAGGSNSTDFIKMTSQTSMNLSATALDTKGTSLSDVKNVEYIWKIHNVTANGTFPNSLSVPPTIKTKTPSVIISAGKTGTYGGYFVLFLDAKYNNVNVSTARYVSVNPAQPVLSSVVATPKVGTYFSGTPKALTVKALDSSSKQITSGLTFDWTVPGIPSWLKATFTNGKTSSPTVTFRLLDPKNHPVWAGTICAKVTSGTGISKQDFVTVSLVK